MTARRDLRLLVSITTYFPGINSGFSNESYADNPHPRTLSTPSLSVRLFRVPDADRYAKPEQVSLAFVRRNLGNCARKILTS